MKILFSGLCIFGIAFVTHLILWRAYIPKRHTNVLLQIFFGTWSLFLIASLVSRIIIPSYVGFLPNNFLEHLYIFLFFTSLTLSYIITYSAIEVDSPSLIMVIAISNAGKEGLAKDKFDEMMNNDILVKPRISDLLRDEMVYMEKDKYCLTNKGEFFIKIFVFYRKLLDAPLKGG